MAQARDSSFEILGEPRRVDDDVAVPEETDGAEASLEKDKKSEEAPAQAVPEPAGAALEPEAKRLRAENGSLTQACDGAVVVAESPDGGSMGGSAADVMAGQAASAVVFPPTHLLMIKTESLCLRSQRAPNAHSGNEYSVLWDRPLGKGSYGTTYVGTAPANMQMAITIFHGVHRARDVDFEIRRHCALGGARNLLMLLECQVF